MILEPGPQTRQRDLPIPVLTAFVTGQYGDARSLVCEPNGRFGGILMLPTGTTGSQEIDATLREELLVVVGNRNRRTG